MARHYRSDVNVFTFLLHFSTAPKKERRKSPDWNFIVMQIKLEPHFTFLSMLTGKKLSSSFFRGPKFKFALRRSRLGHARAAMCLTQISR